MKKVTKSQISFTVLSLFFTLCLLSVFVACHCGSNKYKSYSYAQKDALIKIVKKDLTDVNQEVKNLELKSKKLVGRGKVDADQKITELHLKAEKIKVQIEIIKNAADSDWKTVKKDLNTDFENLNNDIKDVGTWLGEKTSRR